MIKSFIFDRILGFPVFSRRYTVALIGKPGTGKSYHSQRIAIEFNLELIIDDGLLIKDTSIIGGHSAKSEETRIAAIKTAIFFDKFHCASAKDCIRKNKIVRVLVLGTSLKMVNRIVDRLEIGKIHKIIKIEEFLTPGEIQISQIQRNKMGRHIIPVPAIEIKKRYPAIFLYSMQRVINKYINFDQNKINYESSVVRPRFGKNFNISITENAIRQMINEVVYNVNQNVVIRSIRIKWIRNDACRIFLNVAFRSINNISKDTLRVSENIKLHIESHIGIVVENVNISINSIQRSSSAPMNVPSNKMF